MNKALRGADEAGVSITWNIVPRKTSKRESVIEMYINVLEDLFVLVNTSTIEIFIFCLFLIILFCMHGILETDRVLDFIVLLENVHVYKCKIQGTTPRLLYMFFEEKRPQGKIYI